MTPWLQAVPTLLVALALFAVPGAVVVAVLRIRGLAALALAPAISVSIIAVSAIVGPWLNLPWNWTVVGLGTLIVTAAVTIVRAVVPPLRAPGAVGPAWEPRLLRWALPGALLAAVAITARLVLAAGDPDQITQNYDTVFHLNAVWYALQNGDASSFSVIQFVRPGADAPAFYPGAWHGIVALVVQLTGASIATATNATWVAGAAVLWPLSMLFLTRTLVGPRPAVLGAAGVLCAGFATFPFLLLYYGSAYPNGLSNALVPTGIALVLLLLRQGYDQRRRVQAKGTWVMTVVTAILYLPGLALSQPNGLFTIGFILTPLLLLLAHRWIEAGFEVSRRMGRRRRWSLVGSVLLVAALLLSNPTFRGLFYWANPKTMPFTEALWRSLTHFPPPTWLPAVGLTALVVFGLYRLCRRQGRGVGNRWMIATVALCALCYAFATGLDWLPTNFLIAPWYGNPDRIAALMPLLGVPLAAVGLHRLCVLLAMPWRRRVSRARVSRAISSPLKRTPLASIPLASMALAAVLVGASPTLWQMTSGLAEAYAVPSHPEKNKQLDTDELALIRELDRYTDPGDVLANNPWNGSPLAVALADRRVLFPYMSMSALDADSDLLRVRLDDIATDPRVCAAAQRKGVTYLLDFGNRLIEPAYDENARAYPGVRRASGSPAFTLVAREGHAKLYRLTDCAGARP